MQANLNDSHEVQCPHCFAQMNSDPKAKKVRCSKCNTLVQIKKKSMEELSANALEGINERVKKLRPKTIAVDKVPDAKRYITFKKFKGKVISVQKPANSIVVCYKCSSKSRIKKEVGKYCCPSCGNLLIHVKDAATAHYIGVQDKTEYQTQAKNLKKKAYLEKVQNDVIRAKLNPKTKGETFIRQASTEPLTSGKKIDVFLDLIFANSVWFLILFALNTTAWTLGWAVVMQIISGEEDRMLRVVVIGIFITGMWLLPIYLYNSILDYFFICFEKIGIFKNEISITEKKYDTYDTYINDMNEKIAAGMWVFLFGYNMMLGPAVGALCSHLLFFS